MEKKAGHEQMTLGGFLAELFLSSRQRSPDDEDSERCRWSRNLKHFWLMFLFAFAGCLTYRVGLLLCRAAIVGHLRAGIP